jgi:hypothetical protein
MKINSAEANDADQPSLAVRFGAMFRRPSTRPGRRATSSLSDAIATGRPTTFAARHFIRRRTRRMQPPSHSVFRTVGHRGWLAADPHRSTNAMKILLAATLLASISLNAQDSHATKTIQATPAEEAAISAAYDAYIAAISLRVVPKESIDYPLSLITESPENFILERSYYISPNELRGFGLAIPKRLARKQGNRLKGMQDLVFRSEERRQGLHTVVFTQKKVEPSGAANGSQPIRSETNRTSSAAGSRR